MHLGRLDHQVKIRGYRVELGEIESVMARCAGVTQAVVIALRDAGTVRLAGFYTGAEVPSRQFALALREQLPVHMVPEPLVHLTAFPLNANGKVDRKALQESLTTAVG